MKNLYVLLILIIIPLIATSQIIENFIFWEADANSTAVDIQEDPFGDLIILGHHASPIYSLGADRPEAWSHENIFLAKYNLKGEQIWMTELGLYVSTTSSMDIDKDGNIFVATDDDALMFSQVDNAGNLVWQKTLTEAYTRPRTRTEPSRLLVTDDAIYLGATFNDTIYFEQTTIASIYYGPDVMLAKFDKTGMLLWHRPLSCGGGAINSLIEDRAGNILMAGNGYLEVAIDSIVLDGFQQLGFISKFNANGILQWIRKIDDRDYYNICYAIDTDKHNNIYASGNYSGLAKILKLDAAGNLIWEQNAERLDGVNGLGVWDDLAVDDFGNIYLCGSLRGEMTFDGRTINTLGKYEFDRLFAHYTSDGTLQDLQVINSDHHDHWAGILEIRGIVYLAGFTEGIVITQSNPYQSFLTVDRYLPRQNYEAIYEEAIHVFPNPNQGQFCIYLNDSIFGAKLKFSVYDMLGRLIVADQTLDASLQFIDIKLPDLAAGVYHLVFKEGPETIVKSIIIK